MARCQAPTPCDFTDDVHAHGCPERFRGWGDEPAALLELYGTETPEEHERLQDALTHAIDCHLLDSDGYREVTPDDVQGGNHEWLAVRRAIRDGASDTELCDLFGVRWTPDDSDLGGAPELWLKTPACAACGVRLVYNPDHPGAEQGHWYAHPAGPVTLTGHTASALIPYVTPTPAS